MAGEKDKAPASTPAGTVNPKASASNPASNPEPRTDAADTLTPNPVDLTPDTEGEDSGEGTPMTPLEQARADYPPGPQIGQDAPLPAATVLAGQVFDAEEAEFTCRYCGACAFEDYSEFRTHVENFHPGNPVPNRESAKSTTGKEV